MPFRVLSAGAALAPYGVVADDLATTNLFLGVIAAVSVLEVIGLIALIAGMALFTRRLMRRIETFEEQQIKPAAARANAILDDVGYATSTVRKNVSWVADFGRRFFGR
jgi:hypothetical protein